MKFKSGDRARVIAEKNGHGEPIGTIITIEDVDTDVSSVPYRSTVGWWFSDDELEPMEQDTKKDDLTDCLFKTYALLLKTLPWAERDRSYWQSQLASMRCQLAIAYSMGEQDLESKAKEPGAWEGGFADNH